MLTVSSRFSGIAGTRIITNAMFLPTVVTDSRFKRLSKHLSCVAYVHFISTEILGAINIS